MSKSRIKIKIPAIATREEAESAMNALAISANKKRTMLAEMDEEILSIKKEYESPVATLEADIEAVSGALHAWTEAHPEEFPKGRKSIEFLSGILCFRTGTPKLALLNRSWTWEKVLETIRKFSAWKACVRTKEEVNKEQILSDISRNYERDKETITKMLANVGVKVVQEESFFIEPKLSDATVRKTTEAK